MICSKRNRKGKPYVMYCWQLGPAKMCNSHKNITDFKEFKENF